MSDDGYKLKIRAPVTFMCTCCFQYFKPTAWPAAGLCDACLKAITEEATR